MKTTGKIIGRIALLLTAIAILVGISGGLAKAQPIDIDSGPMLVARALCVGSGGDWELTNNVFFCTYPDGHGWKCDMETNPVQCWSFFKVHPGSIKVNIGAAKDVNMAMAPSSGSGPLNGAAAQAKINSALASSAASATTADTKPTPQPTPQPTKVAVKTSKVNANVSTNTNAVASSSSSSSDDTMP